MEKTIPKENTPDKRLTEGCVLCYQGAKMVLFITGLCNRSCWYCPLSKSRKNKDVIYANDRLVSSPDDVIEEARMMSALGTGITGGEPFLVLDRLIMHAGLLKDTFGVKHHIHMYSGVAPSHKQLESIVGLVDEIRLNPPEELWGNIKESSYFASVQAAKDLGFVAGFEVPSLSSLPLIEPALPELDFLNINELEWGESNAAEMRKRGYETEGNHRNAITGVWEYAKDIAKNPKVHWCSSDFKDRVQLRMRLKRIAANTARTFDEITDDGTVIYGVIEYSEAVPDISGIENDLYCIYDDRIEIAWWVLTEINDEIDEDCYIVERYPNNGIIMEVTPL